MPPRFRRLAAAVLSALVLAALLPVAAASGAEPRMSHPWIADATDPDALVSALAENADKIPSEFRERLRWTMSDGTLRVMVALELRNADVEAFVENATTWVHWYGGSPRFLGRVTQEQLVTLLEADVVTFVEPDYPITNFMASSAVDVHARNKTGDPSDDGTAVWSFDPTAGPMGALKSDIPSLTADQATGKGVTVAITDSGIDRTHRDFGGWDCEAGPFQPCQSRILRAVSVQHLVDGGVDPGDSLPSTELASGHGTHVAGTIAGNAYYQRDRGAPPAGDVTTYGGDGYNFGIAPQANLISTKNGDTIWAGLSNQGLQWQLEHADEYNIRVSSNSWGCLGGCSFNGSSVTGQLFKDLYEAGVVVVFAAGNDGGGSDGRSFSGNAQSPYVLGVANYDDNNHRLASSSSRGSDNSLPDPSTWTPASEPVNGERRPDVGAPGTNIWSARTLTGGAASGVPRVGGSDVTGGGQNGVREYVGMSGTSMATPHVAGAAAVMFSACPAATPLDVMRAVMVGADRTEILKTSGSAVAEPFEIGYGSLEIRRSVDWLLSQAVCGGTGTTTEPSPEPTVEPTPEPTQSTEPPADATATKYYLHSVSGFGNVDYPNGDSTFDGTAPTSASFAEYFDVPAIINTGMVDPVWDGTIDEHIDALEVDFWQSSPSSNLGGAVHYDVLVRVGDTEYELPTIERPNEAAPGDITRVTHTFTTMLDGTNEVPLSIDPAGAPIEFSIRGAFIDAEAIAEIVYDSTEFPSSFTVYTGGTGPDPDPTPTVDPTPTEPPPPSGSRGTYPVAPNDPYFPDGDVLEILQQWAPQLIQAPQAWQEPQATGYSVNVAVLDTGVDQDHEDLQCPGKLVAGADFVNDGGGTDDVGGHGTHVTGIIGACTNNGTGMAGVAPDASIMPIQVLDADGAGTVEGIADGIRKAADNGAHVINMSLSLGIGVPGSGAVGWLPGFVPEIDDAVEYANSKGAVIVAAAGNESLPLCEYPAIAKDVICVGATDNRDLKTWYSGFPNKPDLGPSLVAPGGNELVFCDLSDEMIFSLYPAELDACDEGAAGYRNLNGTSMAAPHVAGVAALVYDRLAAQRSPENRQAVVDALVDSAVDLGTPGYDPVFGYGRVDALAAVRAVDAVVVENPEPAASTVELTDNSATSVQYSDEAPIEAALSADGQPIADAELVFELTGASGTRSWTEITNADGIASSRPRFDDDPGSYQLTVRYAGLEDSYLPSADSGALSVEIEDSVTDLTVVGGPTDRALSSSTTDADSAAGIEGVPVEFFADGKSLGTATTDSSGVASFSLPPRYRNPPHTFEAVFGGNAYFSGSSDSQRT